jgi:hypothetical protein
LQLFGFIFISKHMQPLSYTWLLKQGDNWLDFSKYQVNLGIGSNFNIALIIG